MVSAEKLRASGYSYDREIQNWVANEGCQTLSNQDKITFVVETMHECEGTVSLEGSAPSVALLVDS